MIHEISRCRNTISNFFFSPTLFRHYEQLFGEPDLAPDSPRPIETALFSELLYWSWTLICDSFRVSRYANCFLIDLHNYLRLAAGDAKI